jgi:hypothetical protein
LINDGFDPTKWRGKRRARRIASEIDKQHWQNINNVRVSGVGNTNYVLAKDDIGNWYVKKSSSDPEKVIKGAKSLAMFGAGLSAPALPATPAESDKDAESDATSKGTPGETRLGKMMTSETDQYDKDRIVIANAMQEGLLLEKVETALGTNAPAMPVLASTQEAKRLPEKPDPLVAPTKPEDKEKLKGAAREQIRTLSALGLEFCALFDSKVDTEKLTLPPELGEAEAKYKPLKADYDAKQLKLDEANEVQTKAAAEVAAAQVEYDAAGQRYKETSSAAAADADNTTLKEADTAARSALDAADTRRKNANAALASAKLATNEAQKAVDAARKALTEPEQKYSKEKTDDATRVAQLDAAKVAVRKYITGEIAKAVSSWDAKLKDYEKSLEFVGETAAQ